MAEPENQGFDDDDDDDDDDLEGVVEDAKCPVSGRPADAGRFAAIKGVEETEPVDDGRR